MSETIDISDDENEDWLRTTREKKIAEPPPPPESPSPRTDRLKKFVERRVEKK